MAHRLSYLTIKWCRGHADNKYQNRAHELSQEARNGICKLSKKPKRSDKRGLRPLLPGNSVRSQESPVRIGPGCKDNEAGTGTSNSAGTTTRKTKADTETSGLGEGCGCSCGGTEAEATAKADSEKVGEVQLEMENLYRACDK